MKRNITYVFVFCFVCFAFSCSRNFINKAGKDPNTANDVPLNLLLPSAELSSALLHGMELSWYSAIFMQQQAGVTRQMEAADKYNIPNGDLNPPWNNAYANSLSDLNKIITKAELTGNYSYAGIAKILTALDLGQITDSWGDVPYTDALLGSDNTTPSYDNQASIYNAIQQLLSDGISDLNKSSDLQPGQDDFIYNGDLSLWQRAAYVLKARYYNHLSKIDVQGSAVKSLSELDKGGFTDISQDARFAFGSTQTEANPWYQFVNQRGDIRMGHYLIRLMDSIADPRLPVYAQKNNNGNYSGSPAGNPDATASIMGSLYASIDSKIPLVTYTEAKFIEAECAYRINDFFRSASSYNEAIQSSLMTAGVTDTTFLNLYAQETSITISMDKIMVQKYIAMFTQSEVWSDYRRTGYPALNPSAGNFTGNVIPRRLYYPLSEKNYNGTNVPSGDILSRHIWWDK